MSRSEITATFDTGSYRALPFPKDGREAMRYLLAGIGGGLFAGAICVATALGNPAELDAWCSQAKQPSSIALCSDAELRELAIQRNRAFDAARSRLSVDAYNALLRDQNGWV